MVVWWCKKSTEMISSVFAFLHLLRIISTVFASHSQECTQGFMDYELLSAKAAQIGDSSDDTSVNRLMGKGFFETTTYAMPSLSFTCSGTITGFLLAVDIRIDNGRDEYPWIALFNRVDSDTYTLVPGSKRSIILGPDNDFSTSGLYNYTLSSPIQFTSGNIIGVHQPDPADDCVVRLQAVQSHRADNIFVIDGLLGNYNVLKSIESSRLLLLSITDNSECLSDGFISYEDLQVNARLVTFPSGSYNPSLGPHRFFKQIGFTCNCLITHVIAGMKDTISQSSNPSAVTIWRRSNTDSDTYTQSGPTIPLYYSDAVSDISTDYLRWYNLSVPVPVKKGDVLGVYFHIPINEADALIYYQISNGPRTYYSSSTNYQATGYNIYPMVSVIASKTGISVTTATSILSDRATSRPVIDLTDTTIMETSAKASPTNHTSSETGISVTARATSVLCDRATSQSVLDLTDTKIKTTCVRAVSASPTNHTSSNSHSAGSLPVIISVVCLILLLSLGVVSLLIIVIVWYFRTKYTRTRSGINTSEKDDDNPPCELNEAYAVIDDNEQTPSQQAATYDYVDVFNDGDGCSLSSINMKMSWIDSYAVKQQPIYIEGKHCQTRPQ